MFFSTGRVFRKSNNFCNTGFQPVIEIPVGLYIHRPPPTSGIFTVNLHHNTILNQFHTVLSSKIAKIRSYK